MEGGLAFTILLIIAVSGLVMLKFLGVRAMGFVYVEVHELSRDEIVEAGTKASGSLLRRLTSPGSRPLVRNLADGTVEWDIASNDGTLTIRVIPLPGGGFQVGGVATELTIFQLGIDQEYTSPIGRMWTLSKSLCNALYRRFEMPRNPQRLLRQRRRILHTVNAAEHRAAARRAGTGSGPENSA